MNCATHRWLAATGPLTQALLDEIRAALHHVRHDHPASHLADLAERKLNELQCHLNHPERPD